MLSLGNKKQCISPGTKAISLVIRLSSLNGATLVTDLVGTIIGGCRIERLLGKGGMGQVFLAHHIKLNRKEALKVMLGDVTGDDTFQQRFMREAALVARLQHEHIIKVFEFDQQNGTYFMRMEYMPEGSLRGMLARRVQERRPLPLAFGLNLARQAAEALAYAHERGVIHRDIKPDNLLLSRQRQADGSSVYTLKTGDFGLARLTESASFTASGMVMGTLAYMSPEQCQGLEVDGRTDIYSLGVVLYEIIAGYPPFAVQTPSDGIRKHLHTPPPPPRQVRSDIPPEVEALVLRCLAKQPGDRFASAAELADSLRLLVEELGAAQATPPQRATMPQVRVFDRNGQQVRQVALDEAGLTLGRLSGNTIALDDSAIGRNHLRIEWRGTRARLTSLSAQPTFVNGELVPSQTANVWWPGQIAQVGPFSLLLDLPGAPSAPLSVLFVDAPDPLVVTPGVALPVQVRIINGGPHATFTLTFDGLPDRWLNLHNGPIELAPGETWTTLLTINAPALPETTAGAYPVRLQARSLHDGSELGVAHGRWQIEPFMALRLVLLPESKHHNQHGDYVLRLSNGGNAPARFHLSVAEASGVLTCKLDRDEVETLPGQTIEIPLHVSARRRLLGNTRHFPFAIRAEAEGSSGEVAGEFVQTTLVMDWT